MSIYYDNIRFSVLIKSKSKNISFIKPKSKQKVKITRKIKRKVEL